MLRGLEKMFVVTMQAVSGAGLSGVASLDISQCRPRFIGGEEEKMEEDRRIAWQVGGSRFVEAGPRHQRSLQSPFRSKTDTSMSFAKLEKIATLGEVREALRNFNGERRTRRSSLRPRLNKKNPVIVLERKIVTQPRRDVDAGKWHGSRCRRVRECVARRKNCFALSQHLVRRSSRRGPFSTPNS